MKSFLAAIILFTGLSSFAGFATEYKPIGFSEDGKYFAFMQDGIQDGSGDYVASIDVIEVAANKLVARHREFASGEESDASPTESEKAKAVGDLYKTMNLSQYGIDIFDPEKGNTLIARPNSDLSNYTNAIFALMYWPQSGANGALETYELKITTVLNPNEKPEDYCYEPSELLKLSLIGNHYGGTTSKKVLQEDSRLPQSRYCASGYQVRFATEYKGQLVVGVRFQMPGFEGNNETFMAVSGAIL